MCVCVHNCSQSSLRLATEAISTRLYLFFNSAVAPWEIKALTCHEGNPCIIRQIEHILGLEVERRELGEVEGGLIVMYEVLIMLQTLFGHYLIGSSKKCFDIGTNIDSSILQRKLRGETPSLESYN